MRLDRRKLRKSLYTAAQWTWGLPQTLIGAGLYMKHRHDRHFDYQGACVTAWDRDDGVSLGKFIFVPERSPSSTVGQNDTSGSITKASHTGVDISLDTINNVVAGSSKNADPGASQFLLEHEYGHTLQSLILGPAYMLLVGAPSIVWNRSGYFARKRKETGRSYYSAIFERTASGLGEKAAARLAGRPADKTAARPSGCPADSTVSGQNRK